MKKNSSRAIKFRLDQALGSLIVGPDPYNLQPGLTQQYLPFLLRTLLDGSHGHHDPIHRRSRPRGSVIGHDEIVDEQFRVAGLHGWDDVLKDLEARGVVPVVQDRVEIVCSGAWYEALALNTWTSRGWVFTFDWLRSEEVVDGQFYARRCFADLNDCGLLVLEHHGT